MLASTTAILIMPPMVPVESSIIVLVVLASIKKGVTMLDLLATSLPESGDWRFVVTPMEVIEVSLPLDETLAMEIAAPPTSTLVKVGDATSLPPLLIDKPNTSLPGLYMEAFSAMSSLVVD